MKRILIASVLALGMVLIPVSGLQAATSADITINATPAFISILGDSTWTINGITGSGVIALNTTYYANTNGDTVVPTSTVGDTDCLFTVTNASTVPINLAVNFSHFTGGDAMQNSNAGTNGANTFGAFAYASGANYAAGKVIAKTTGSDPMKTNMLPAATSLKWGLTILTQTGAWASGTPMTAHAIVTAVAYS